MDVERRRGPAVALEGGRRKSRHDILGVFQQDGDVHDAQADGLLPHIGYHPMQRLDGHLTMLGFSHARPHSFRP